VEQESALVTAGSFCRSPNAKPTRFCALCFADFLCQTDLARLLDCLEQRIAYDVVQMVLSAETKRRNNLFHAADPGFGIALVGCMVSNARFHQSLCEVDKT
jgi:hypothetical protein